MLSLAVFYFVFLGTEYLFDNRMALYTDPSGVVLAQSYILGVSVFGFLAYSLTEKIGRAHVCTPVTTQSRMPSSA